MKNRIWIATFVFLYLLVANGCSHKVTTYSITPTTEGSAFIGSKEFISINSVRYFNEDYYENNFTTMYRIFSPEEQLTTAFYNPYNSEPYEITVKKYSDTRFLSWGSFLSNLLGDPLVFASEEICTLRYLEDITLCSKITVESIGSSCFTDGEHELSTELNETVYGSVAKKYLQNNIGLSKADIDAETYTVYIYPKGINAAVEVALITSDIDGKVGILTDENTVIPLDKNFQNLEVFVSEVL